MRTRTIAVVITFAFVLALIVGVKAGFSQTQTTKSATIISAYDLDGEAADVDQVIVATAIVDNGTSVADANWAIVAQPDSCRLLDLTIADTDMTAGTITVTGTDCLGYAKVCSWSAWTAGDDDGVKTLTCTDGKGAYYVGVTTVTTGAMTGESDETFALGYSTNSANGLVMYGTLLPVGISGEHGVSPFSSYRVSTLITTTNALSTTITGTGAFTTVVVGDLLLISQIDASGNTVTYERRVTARASADSITVNSALLIPTAGVYFNYKHKYFSTDPTDQLWIPVGGWKTAAFNWSVDSNTDTGGVVALLECTDSKGPDWPTGGWVTISTATAATGVAAVPSMTALGPVDLTLAPFSYCRVGHRFGTGDDDDTGVEDINLSVVLSR